MEANADRKLLDEIKANPQRFGILFDQCYQDIFSYIFHRVGDYDIARDIAAETFLKAFLNIQSFTWRGVPLSFWLYRIATNEVNLFFRRRKFSPESLPLLIEKNSFDFFDPDSAQTEKSILENELRQHEEFLSIQRKLKELSTKYQEVIALRYFEKKSIKEIATILGKKEGTVKSLLSRAIDKLKKLL